VNDGPRQPRGLAAPGDFLAGRACATPINLFLIHLNELFDACALTLRHRLEPPNGVRQIRRVHAGLGISARLSRARRHGHLRLRGS
jgi:hypothetical protein